MKSTNKKIIIGLDGVPYSLIKDLSDVGVMRNTKAIIERGILSKMQSSIPEVSSVAWSSIITGCNPAEHGIFGFMEIPQGTYRLSFPNFNNLKVKPFWNRSNERCIVINVPSTYPARELNGILISGFVALDLNKATYPQSLVPKLKEMNYRIDVNTSYAHESMSLFLNDLNKTLKARISAYRYLWDNENWQTFMFIFTETDRLSHFLWDAHQDKTHKYHKDFLNVFKKIDEVIGEITDKIKDNDCLILLSDHGFESLKYDVHINYYLKECGFLRLKEGEEVDYSNIDFGTVAFTLDPARIYINLKNKYPCGKVSSKDRESIIEDLKSAFENLKIDGKKVIKDMFRKEEIYEGPFLEDAPDLVLLSNKGFNLKANIKAKELHTKGIFTGKHTQSDAFLLISKHSEDIIPADLSVSDVVSIMDKL